MRYGFLWGRRPCAKGFTASSSTGRADEDGGDWLRHSRSLQRSSMHKPPSLEKTHSQSPVGNAPFPTIHTVWNSHLPLTAQVTTASGVRSADCAKSADRSKKKHINGIRTGQTKSLHAALSDPTAKYRNCKRLCYSKQLRVEFVCFDVRDDPIRD